jgi:uncharacterized protein
VISNTPDGALVDVRVVPRAGRTAVVGIRDDEVIARVAAPPVEGAANEALVELLAETFHVARRAVRIVRGERGRRKRIAIAGVTAADVRALCSRSRS